MTSSIVCRFEAGTLAITASLEKYEVICPCCRYSCDWNIYISIFIHTDSHVPCNIHWIDLISTMSACLKRSSKISFHFLTKSYHLSIFPECPSFCSYINCLIFTWKTMSMNGHIFSETLTTMFIFDLNLIICG